MDLAETGGRPSRTLLDALAELPDPRSRHGRRYALPSLLGLAVCAMLCGARSLSAIAQWGRDHGPKALRPLGFTRKGMPCVATLHLLFKVLDRGEFEQVLRGWFLQQIGAAGAVSVDGKCLRGSSQDGVPGVHLVAAFSQEYGLALGQEATADKGGEVAAVHALLESLPIAGMVITGDAQFTQRKLSEAIGKKGGTIFLWSRTTSQG